MDYLLGKVLKELKVDKEPKVCRDLKVPLVEQLLTILLQVLPLEILVTAGLDLIKYLSILQMHY